MPLRDGQLEMETTRSRQVDTFVQFVLSAHSKELLNLLRSPKSDQQHYGVRISLAELAAHCPAAAEQLMKAPREVGRAC